MFIRDPTVTFRNYPVIFIDVELKDSKAYSDFSSAKTVISKWRRTLEGLVAGGYSYHYLLRGKGLLLELFDYVNLSNINVGADGLRFDYAFSINNLLHAFDHFLGSGKTTPKPQMTEAERQQYLELIEWNPEEDLYFKFNWAKTKEGYKFWAFEAVSERGDRFVRLMQEKVLDQKPEKKTKKTSMYVAADTVTQDDLRRAFQNLAGAIPRQQVADAAIRADRIVAEPVRANRLNQEAAAFVHDEWVINVDEARALQEREERRAEERAAMEAIEAEIRGE